MKKIKFILLSIICLSALYSKGQNSLQISNGTSVVITSGTSVAIDGIVLQPSLNLILEGPNSFTRHATATPAPSSPIIQRVYHLLSSINFSGDLIFNYSDAELNGLDENELTFLMYDGAAWNHYNSNVTWNAANNILTISSLSNVSINDITLTEFTNTLPVVLSSFSVNLDKCRAVLEWKTAVEQNSKQFEIEISQNGIDFKHAGSKQAAGNSEVELNYKFETMAAQGENFFRIKMVDLDGSFSYSEIKRVVGQCSNIRIFPNPISDLVNISGLDGKNTIHLVDAMGKILVNMTTVNNTEKIRTAHLPQGIYMLQVIKDNRLITTIKLIKN